MKDSVRGSEVNARKSAGGGTTVEDCGLSTLEACTNSLGSPDPKSDVDRSEEAGPGLDERVVISEMRYRRLFEAASDGIVILDSASHRIIDANPFFMEFLGYRREELLGKELWKLSLLADEAASRAAFRELQQKGQIRCENLPLQTKAGHKRDVEVIANLYDENGRQVIQCNLRDITERKRAEAVLRENEERFRMVADNISQLAWTCDRLGNVTWYNQRWLDYTGLTFEDMRAWGWTKCHHPDHVERVVQSVKRARESGDIWEDTFPLRGKDGNYRWFLSRALPIRDAQGNIVRWFGTNTDVTDQQRIEEALRHAHELISNQSHHLEKLVQERTARLRDTVAELEHFSYTITHDMRAPLRSMRGFGEVLIEDLGGQISPENADYLRRIVDAANRMDALITDSLQYAKVVREPIRLVSVEATHIIRGILESYPNLQPPHVEIQVVEPLPRIIANETGLAQCFSNLLVNSVKFVKRGTTPKIRIWAESVPASLSFSEQRSRSGEANRSRNPAGDIVRFWVEDNGIGIPREYHERIFGMFQQLDRSYEGTGIGLALVRKTSERMGGQVGVESEPGKGSRFWLEFKKAEGESNSSSIFPDP